MLEQYIRASDVFIVCFSIADRRSFESVARYAASIERVLDDDGYPGRPIILVGCKHDLLEQPRAYPDCISFEEASELAQRIGADAYIETSAMRREHVDEAFQEGIGAVLARIEERRRQGSSGALEKSNKCVQM
jgi:GTPase SAR1 family protein